MAPWTQAALGTALFCLFIDCRLALIDGLLRHDGFGPSRRETPRYERVRIEGARASLDWLLGVLASSSHENEDASRVSALLANGDGFVRDLRCMVDALPDGVVERGLAVARASLRERP